MFTGLLSLSDSLYLVNLQPVLGPRQFLGNIETNIGCVSLLAFDSCRALRPILYLAPGQDPHCWGVTHPAAQLRILAAWKLKRPRAADLQGVFLNSYVFYAAKVSRTCPDPGLDFGAACKVAPL